AGAGLFGAAATARSELEPRADVDRLVVLLGRIAERHQPVPVLRVANPRGHVEVARQAIAALEVDRLIGSDPRSRRARARCFGIDPRGKAARRLLLRARSRANLREIGNL